VIPEVENRLYYNQLYGYRSLLGFKIHALFSFDQKSKARPLCKILIPFIDEICTATGEKTEVLDYGCGWGKLIMALPSTKIVASIYDISDICVNRVKHILRLRSQKCKVATNIINTNQATDYHIIVCSHVLEHVTSDKHLLLDFHSAIKKRGYLVINVPINEVWVDPKHVRKYDPVLIKKLIDECGFQVIAGHQVDRWTAFILKHEVRMKFSWIAKIVFKPLRLVLAVIPYQLALLGERLFCSRYAPQQYIIVARKV